MQEPDEALLIILDGVEAAGREASVILEDAAAFQLHNPKTRILALIESQAAKRISLPSVFARHELLPFLKTQRLQAVTRFTGCAPAGNASVLSKGAANPAQFVMAMKGGGQEDTMKASLIVGSKSSQRTKRPQIYCAVWLTTPWLATQMMEAFSRLFAPDNCSPHDISPRRRPRSPPRSSLRTLICGRRSF